MRPALSVRRGIDLASMIPLLHARGGPPLIGLILGVLWAVLPQGFNLVGVGRSDAVYTVIWLHKSYCCIVYILLLQ